MGLWGTFAVLIVGTALVSGTDQAVELLAASLFVGVVVAAGHEPGRRLFQELPSIRSFATPVQCDRLKL